MEPHVIEAILLALAEDAKPLSLISRRVTRQGEDAVLHRAAQEYPLAIKDELAPINGNIAQTESHGYLMPPIRYRACIELRMELIPRLHIIAQRKMECSIVDENIYGACLHVGHHPLSPNERGCLKLYAPRYAVPIALRLVSHRVRILTYADILYAVIDTDGNLILASGLDKPRDIVLMRRGQAHLMPHLTTVDKHRRLYVRTLQIEHNAARLAP